MRPLAATQKTRPHKVKTTTKKKKKLPNKKKKKKTTTTTRRRLLPIMDPVFNMREILKQVVLLEDHLFHAQKRCRDCVNKHFLTIEALAEEAISLACPVRKNCPEELDTLPGIVRGLHHRFDAVMGQDKEVKCVATELRHMRKALMSKYSVLSTNLLPDDERKIATARGGKRAQKKNI
jgi:hypothetical protein